MHVLQDTDRSEVEGVVRKMAKEAPFKEWQHKLTPGDRLPRGKFFKGKSAGQPLFIMDEAWAFLGNASGYKSVSK